MVFRADPLSEDKALMLCLESDKNFALEENKRYRLLHSNVFAEKIFFEGK